jgi:DNA (cytosine-5)-methyltransferase 1
MVALADAGQIERRARSEEGPDDDQAAERDEGAVNDQQHRADNPWVDCIWIECTDGKLRPIPAEPALFPLADGVPNRMGTLCGSGNAIVPQLAAVFIRCAEEARRSVK